MIRPFTLICMLLACGSGLYLYQTKHRVQLLDRAISQTVQATTAARDRAGILRTEWTLLNDLERLRVLSDQHMRLRPVAPGQFTSLADLGSRLPPPRAPEPERVASPVLQVEALPALAGENGPGQPEPEMADLPTPPVPPSAFRNPAREAQVASGQTNAFPAGSNPAAASLAAARASKAAADATQARAAADATQARAAADATQARAAERRQMADATIRGQPGAGSASVSAPVSAQLPRSMAIAASSQAMGGAAYSPPQTSSLGMAARTMMRPPVPVSAVQYTSPN